MIHTEGVSVLQCEKWANHDNSINSLQRVQCTFCSTLQNCVNINRLRSSISILEDSVCCLTLNIVAPKNLFQIWFTFERVAINCIIVASVLRILSVRYLYVNIFTQGFTFHGSYSIKHNQFFPLQCYWTLWIIGIDCDSQKVWNQIGGWDIIVAPRRGSCLMDFWTQKVKKWSEMKVGKIVLKPMTDRNAVGAEASIFTLSVISSTPTWTAIATVAVAAMRGPCPPSNGTLRLAATSR